MQADTENTYFTPPRTPSTIDLSYSPPCFIATPKIKFRTISPETLSGINKVLDFSSFDSPFKRKNKISKRISAKDKGTDRIQLVKLR